MTIERNEDGTHQVKCNGERNSRKSCEEKTSWDSPEADWTSVFDILPRNGGKPTRHFCPMHSKLMACASKDLLEYHNAKYRALWAYQFGDLVVAPRFRWFPWIRQDFTMHPGPNHGLDFRPWYRRFLNWGPKT